MCPPPPLTTCQNWYDTRKFRIPEKKLRFLIQQLTANRLRHARGPVQSFDCNMNSSVLTCEFHSVFRIDWPPDEKKNLLRQLFLTKISKKKFQPILFRQSWDSWGQISLLTDRQIFWHHIRGCVDIFFKLNLLPPYLLRSQGDKVLQTFETSPIPSAISTRIFPVVSRWLAIPLRQLRPKK